MIGECRKLRFKAGEHVYASILATVHTIDAKKPPKCLKKNGKCRKTIVKASEHTFWAAS